MRSAALLAATALILSTSAGPANPGRPTPSTGAAASTTLSVAPAQGDPIGGSGYDFFLNDQFTGTTNIRFQYGSPTDIVYFGDWDGNGTDTPMIQRGSVFHVRNTTTSGAADFTFTYGNPGDRILVGDWDGDGKDTLAVRRSDWSYVRNSTTSGVADVVFSYGNPGDVILVGDWDGDGKDTLAVRRGISYYLRNSTTSGTANTVVNYGEPTDRAFAGDWNGDGKDTLGLRRPLPPPPPPSNPALFVYGTLRNGMSGYSTYLAGRTTSEIPARLPWYSMYIYGSRNSVFAVPDVGNGAGLIGETMFIRGADYATVLARIDAYERYYPANPSQSTYVRQQVTTAQGHTAWVYVAASRLRSVIRGSGTFIASGNYFDYLRRW